VKAKYVNQIQERDRVNEPFLVKNKVMGMAKNGKPYLTLRLMDRTGEVEGRVWDRVDEFSACFEQDDFIHVSSKASVYMGKMQLVIQDLKRLDDSLVDLSDYLPVADSTVDEMLAELRDSVAGLVDEHLRALMDAFLADDEFLRRYSMAPAAKAMHHVYLGGLLEHSLAVARLASDIAGRYPGVNRDLLVVGALLHDIGKVAELRYERSFEYTDAGKLLGHIMIGVEMIEEKVRQLPGFPRELAILLKHLLLSHHGQYEYGSPKRPKTLEAVILNFIDDLDSKINGVQTHIGKEPDSDSSWTQYHRMYDRYFFKGYDKPLEKGDPFDGAGSPEALPTAEQKRDANVSRPVKSRFSNTLQEQLQGKSLDLSTTEQRDVDDE
jgi:3'-5' exoribonuclease